MSEDFFSKLDKKTRILMEAELRPCQGDRFQSTGFPHLGPALYEVPARAANESRTQMLLVESAQSVANGMEAVCWDHAKNDLIPELQELPYVKVKLGPYGETSTLLEFHRLNSPYIWAGETDSNGDKFRNDFRSQLGMTRIEKKAAKKQKSEDKSVGKNEKADWELLGIPNLSRFAKTVFKYDPCSIIHGLFLEMLDGRLSLTRALSGFIEASNVCPVESGGVKFDRVSPKGNLVPRCATEKERQRLGHVPHARTEFTAEKIMAYFSLDLAMLRSYGFDRCALDLLVALSLFKVQAFLDEKLHLRSGCDFKTVDGLKVTMPEGINIPQKEKLLAMVKQQITTCKNTKGVFAVPSTTIISRELEIQEKPDEQESAAENTQQPQDDPDSNDL